MATDPLAETASAAAANDTLSPAQQLMQKHTADESHKPTVEDVVDEEDVVHPPPSITAHVPVTEPAQPPSTTIHVPVTEPPQPNPSSQPLSAKAAGKQREQVDDTSGGPATKATEPPLNVQSEEMFPSLGAPKGPSLAVQTWGTKPASVKMNGIPNGSLGPNPTSSNGSSRGPTAAPRFATPASARGLTPQVMPLMPLMPLPGQHVESISLVPSQMKPRAQLKKPLPDILRDINKRSKAKVDMKVGAGSEYIFEARGPVDAVRQALNEVADELGSKQSIRVTIPESVRPHIIGRGGANIKNIEKATRARLRVPDRPDASSLAEDDDSATTDVIIEGNALSAEMARRQVEAIVNDRTSTVNLRMRDIPPELFPFLAGAHNSNITALAEGRDVRVDIPHYHTWSGQPPTALSAGQSPAFKPQAGRSIQISGERQAAQAVKEEVEQRARELQNRLTMHQEAVDRGRHQFIIGERGSSLHDFLKETGCAVILPPDSDDSDTITIVGPPEKIEDGINKVQDLAMSMQMLPVNVAKQHANAPAGPHVHSRDLARYLQQRQALRQLEAAHNAHIVIPASQDAPWEIYARDGKNAMRARTDLTNLISGHPPARVMHVDMDPFYHQHLEQQLSPQLARNGVYAIYPEEHEQSPHVMLVYEGPTAGPEYQFPRSQPSPDEVKEFERALREAQQLMLGMVPAQQQIVSRNVEAPAKFHDKLRRYVEKEQSDLPQEQLPVHVQIGKSRLSADPAAAANGVLMRGPSDAVDNLSEKIAEFIIQEEKDEKERGYTTTFDFPQKFANYLIGKRGENINKLREEFDVEIKLDDGKVTIQGPEAKAHAARRHILEEAKKWEDQATHVLKIKPQYHGELIGPKGSQINRLQERYDVRINFPRSVADHPEADAGSESGAPRSQRANQAQDEVIIKGRKRGADEARDELLSLLQYIMDNSHTATVSVAQSQVPQLIGQGGREMENLRLTTGCQIDVPGTRDAVDPSGRVEIRLKGTKQQVDEAKRLLQERAKAFDNTITRTLDVDRKHHGALIGAGGTNIRDIVLAAGGPDDRRELARMVRFPRSEADGNTIRVEGNKDVVEKIVAAIQAAARQRESEVVETVEVAPDKHRVLIGRGGETRRNLESQFGVGIDIPKQSVTGAARSQVKISGQPDAVEQAKVHVLSLVKEQEGETIQIPHSHHHIVSDNGQLFRRLRNNHRVTVEHAGQQPPPRPAASQSPGPRTSSVALPLITDDTSPDANNHSWELIDLTPPSPSAETIPWVLRGSPENIARARSLIEAALAQAHQQSSTGYLFLPDPRMYRFVVGQGGSTINGIRRETGCRIQVPKGEGGPGEAIEIVGTREGVEEARDRILEAVMRGGQGGKGRA